ncbi:hypothetical protein NEDG_00317 [Nematocida displodere]|uniref:Uncharacterized protein n=1 Tax=Nematocida displodere TaxID=1805483 RepID=A0A177EL64_9MICR|nr:hypothetical protein NEDG_00317 [Nematocida displodere]
MKDADQEGQSLGERNMHLEGQVEILQKKLAAARKGAHDHYAFIQEECKSGVVHIERLKKELNAAKAEIRMKSAQLVGLGSKRPKVEPPVEAKENLCSSPCTPHTLPPSYLSPALRPDSHPRPSPDSHPQPSPDSQPIRLEWLLSNLKSEINLELTELTADKLKRFGRFFKKDFDSKYNEDVVMKGLECGVSNTRDLVKSILYLSDRPEIVAQMLPYVFKKHIIPEGGAYIKDVVKILYRAGVSSFLCDNDIIADIRTFFEACGESPDLLFFIADLCDKSPTSAARLVSEEYLVKIAQLYPKTALSILQKLGKSRVRVDSERATEIVHLNIPQADPGSICYTCEDSGNVFYFGSN